MKKQKVKYTCKKEDDGLLLVDIIAKNSSFSKSLLKKMMAHGSIFQTFKGKTRNVRKARHTLKAGDVVECYYDPSLNFDTEFEFKLLLETANYGIYHKPAGAMTEGTRYGDKTSLTRHVEKLKRYVYLINRIDREVEGLIVVAYNSKTQNLLQQIWRDNVMKRYQAIVLGNIQNSGVFEQKINNKFSKTSYQLVKEVEGLSYLEIQLATERKHQIRIHFSDNGTPILGDPIYGQHNKNKEGIKLISYSLEFIDPHSKKQIKVELPKEQRLFT